MYLDNSGRINPPLKMIPKPPIKSTNPRSKNRAFAIVFYFIRKIFIIYKLTENFKYINYLILDYLNTK